MVKVLFFEDLRIGLNFVKNALQDATLMLEELSDAVSDPNLIKNSQDKVFNM